VIGENFYRQREGVGDGDDVDDEMMMTMIMIGGSRFHDDCSHTGRYFFSSYM